MEAASRSAPEGVYCITDVARSVIARGYPLGKSAGVSAYCAFYITQTNYEDKYDSSFSPHLLSDRCLIDLLAHGRVNARQKFTIWPSEFLEMIEQVSRRRCKFYDKFVYLPIEFAQESDGVRDKDLRYRADVGDEIENIMSEWKLDAMVLTGSVEARKRKLLAVMAQYEKVNS